MDVTASGSELRDAARLARESVVVDRAVALGRWIGTDRRSVTAGQVLRKADVPAAAAALGVDVPTKLRTMADIRALHRPWCVAVAGLLQIGGGWVTGGAALDGWPPGDADLLAGWLAGLRAVCAAESYPQHEDSVRLLAMALLTVLGSQKVPRRDGLWVPVNTALHDLGDRYDMPSWEAAQAADRYYDLETGTPLAGLVALLAGFGAVTVSAGKPVITALGRRAAAHLADGQPGPADPAWPAADMIAAAAQFSDEEQRHHVVSGWLAGRGTAQAALPVWRETRSSPLLGPQARAELAAWDQGPEPGDTDWEWLAVEAAAAALEDKGPDEALTPVWEGMPGADLDAHLAAVRATGHPDATWPS